MSSSLLDCLSSCLPCFVLLLSCPFLISGNRWRGRKRGESWGVINNTRIFLALLTLLFTVILRLLLVLSSSLCTTDILLLCTSLLTLLLGLGHHLSVLLSNQVTSVTITFFWLLSFLCNLPHMVKGITFSLPFPLLLFPLTIQVLTGLLFLLQWFPYSAISNNENGSSFLQNLVFHFLSRLFFRGFRNKLLFGDLPSLPKILHIPSLLASFRSSRNSPYNIGDTSRKLYGGDSDNLYLALVRCCGPKLVLGFLLRSALALCTSISRDLPMYLQNNLPPPFLTPTRMLNDVLLFLSPQILRRILQVKCANTSDLCQELELGEDSWRGYAWSGVLLCSMVSCTLVSDQVF